MSGTQPAATSRTGNLLGALAVLVLALGIGGYMDLANQSYTGFFTDGNSKVTAVLLGSPAEAAGMKVGDEITSVGGVSVNDTKGVMAQARQAIGEVRPYIVQRDAKIVMLPIRASGLPRRDLMVGRLAFAIGLAYILLGLWAFFAVPSRATTVFAVFGLCFGQAFVGAPYSDSAALRNVIAQFTSGIVLLGLAALVHFLLAFPEPRPILSRPGARRIIYAPALVAFLTTLGFTLLAPDASSGLNVFFRVFFDLVYAGYFLVALVTLFARFAGASPETRMANGLGLMLLGAVVGLGPLIMMLALSIASPSAVLPGSQYYFLTLALIPLTFAGAIRRSAKRSLVSGA